MVIAMDIKEYFDDELKSTLLHTAAGIAAGYLSFVINSPALSVVAMLGILGVAQIFARFAWKMNKDSKWWLGNGIAAYAFSWLVVWTIFYNLPGRIV